MSTSEDFGPLLDVLVTCVGAVDVFSVVALIYNGNQTNASNSQTDMNNNDIRAFQSGKIRDKSPLEALKAARSNGSGPLVIIDKSDDVISSLTAKVNELELKVEELEVRSRENSMERFLDDERERLVDSERFRRSQSPTPHRSKSSTFLERENGENDDDDEETHESHGDAESESPNGSTRDDEAIKRPSRDDDDGDDIDEGLADASLDEMNDSNFAQFSDGDDENAQHRLMAALEQIDVNENFIKMERMDVQMQSPKILVKQAQVNSEDFPEESATMRVEQEFNEVTSEAKVVGEELQTTSVSSPPKIANFPKSNEIASVSDESVSELISTRTESQVPNAVNIEQLPSAVAELPVMVQGFAETLTAPPSVEETGELPPLPQSVEIINEPQSVIGSLMDVNIAPSINLQTRSNDSISVDSSAMNLNASTSSLHSRGNTSLTSAALENDYAVRRMTPEPDIILIKYRLKLIFSGEYTKAMSKDWHSGHFCCWNCDESLTGQRYVLRDEHPYCIKCYESVFANTCEECSTLIGIDSKDLSYKDKHWHEACFLCNMCRVSLVDKQFGSKTDKIYCGNCYDSQFASRCDGCGEVFRAGTKKMEYKTRQWHEKCFCCCVCKTPIGTKSFIPREQDIYCAGCYEDKFATRCIKCKKVITTGGVTYKNDPWHRECFVCTHCETPLAGQRFTSRDEKPYCADCFGELFAKRCTACTKPITGIGGTRFISFEDRHWHNDCFICGSCKTSLVGRGFITDEEDDIICPDCAKAKLMAS